MTQKIGFVRLKSRKAENLLCYLKKLLKNSDKGSIKPDNLDKNPKIAKNYLIDSQKLPKSPKIVSFLKQNSPKMHGKGHFSMNLPVWFISSLYANSLEFTLNWYLNRDQRECAAIIFCAFSSIKDSLRAECWITGSSLNHQRDRPTKVPNSSTLTNIADINTVISVLP